MPLRQGVIKCAMKLNAVHFTIANATNDYLKNVTRSEAA